MEIKDPKVVHDYLNGVIEGEDVKRVLNCIQMLRNSIRM